MGVDEAGQGDEARRVDRDRPGLGLDPRPELLLGPGEDHEAFRRSQPAVLDDADLPQGRASPGQGPRAGHELAAAGDDEIS